MLSLALTLALLAAAGRLTGPRCVMLRLAVLASLAS
jgi:hypothetical protein